MIAGPRTGSAYPRPPPGHVRSSAQYATARSSSWYLLTLKLVRSVGEACTFTHMTCCQKPGYALARRIDDGGDDDDDEDDDDSDWWP